LGTQTGILSFRHYSAYSLNFTPSDFHPFCPLKKHLDSKRFSGDTEVEHEVKTRLMEQTTAALEMKQLGAVKTQIL
jgi:hypothetical protein